MPNGFETYQLYVAIKNHFSQASYDFHKYKGKVRVTEETYEKRPDKYMFHKLGQKYPREKLVNLFVSNFVIDTKIWIGDFVLSSDESEQNYTQWLAIVDKITYHVLDECDGIFSWLQNNKKRFADLFLVDKSDHPIIVKMLLQKTISLETFVVLDSVFGFCRRVNKKISDIIWNDIFHKVRKYRPFLEYDPEKLKKLIQMKLKREYDSLLVLESIEARPVRA